MRVRVEWWMLAGLVAALAACGSDKSNNPANADAGPSETGESGGSGQSSGSAGAIGSKTGSATATGTSGSGGSKSAAAGGTGGSAGSNAGSSGKAGSAEGSSGKAGSPEGGSGTAGTNNSSMSGDNAGSGSDAGSGNSGSSPSSLPSNGDQNSLCTMAVGDCNKGLACNAPAGPISPGRGYCSKICSKDEDCSGIGPASVKYTCSIGAGTQTCEVQCTGTDDMSSCPPSMKCVETAPAVPGRPAPPTGPMRAGTGGAAAGAGGAGGTIGGRPAEYRCRYPFDTSGAYGPCGDEQHVCDKDLTCIGAGPNRSGLCAPSCKMDSDCSAKPSSGSATPTCVTLLPARGMNPATQLCMLDCSAAKDSCPTGTMCVDGPPVPVARGGAGGEPASGGAGGTAGAAGRAGPPMIETMPAYSRCE